MVIQKIKNYYNKLKESYINDPVRHCPVYKDLENGSCVHVDSYLCNMRTCNILKEYSENTTNKN